MEWIRMHPYASALSAAGILLVVGAFVVNRKAAVAPTAPSTSTWAGANAPVLNREYYSPSPVSARVAQNQNSSNILRQVQNGPPYTYTLPSTKSTSTSAPSGGSDSFDFDAFVAMLQQGSASAKPGKTGSAAEKINAYSFIPSGLMSTTTRSTTRTDTQQGLYDYGNEAGSYVQSYEEQHPNVPQILKNQFEERGNPDKAAAVVAIGNALIALGDSLSNMDTVPSAITSAHAALAKSYREIGKNLTMVPKAASDSDLIRAIEVYDTSADTFTKNYIAVVTLFGAYGVTFASDDPGSVFTFTNASF